MTQTDERGTPPGTKSMGRSLAASAVGNLLEWYEWSIYAVFAPFIAAAMFSPGDPVSALLSTFAVFAVGFGMRPLGGIVFGRIADRRGRKFVLVTTMLMMAAGSFAIGLLPTYASIGAGASLLLLAIRMVQGFAHGGESATANVYIAEIAPRDRRGMWGSVVFGAIFGGSSLAYALGGGLTATVGTAVVADWAWRLPFLLGGVLALFVLILRRQMDESEIFETTSTDDGNEAVDTVETAVPRVDVVRSILLVIGLTAGVAAAHYTWTSYISTYAITEQGMNVNSAYWVSVCAQVLALASIGLWGRLSDTIGRRPLLAGFAVAMLVLQIPLTRLISDQPWTLLVASGVALVFVAAAGAVLAATMAELFPTRIRTQAVGFTYATSVAVFGGTAPYLNQLFVSLDAKWAFSAYIMALCVVVLLTLRVTPETRGMDLSDAGSRRR